MPESTLIILLAALILDWYFGEPDFSQAWFPHPVVLFGKAVAFADQKLNRDSDLAGTRYKMGALAISLLILAALAAALLVRFLTGLLGPIGFLAEMLIVFVLLAQHSLAQHVRAVADGLRENGIEGGREAVGRIVGRDPDLLDTSGVCRAAIESLAENFSDGVVAPAFWYAVFGLPGLFIYKMINTADSMIGYKSEKYLWFGRAAAQIDDLANWLPARFSALLIAAGSATLSGLVEGKRAITAAFQSAGLHRSPNAGWPEAAMAGGIGLALGGPRTYEYGIVDQAWLNGSGKQGLDAGDIRLALQVFTRSCYALWAAVLLALLIF